MTTVINKYTAAEIYKSRIFLYVLTNAKRFDHQCGNINSPVSHLVMVKYLTFLKAATGNATTLDGFVFLTKLSYNSVVSSTLGSGSKPYWSNYSSCCSHDIEFLGIFF